jgi:Cu-processing system permease protein
MDCHVITTIAGQETRINIRNKWALIFALVFGVLALAISYFGLATAAVVGFQGFTRTCASLLNLVLYLIPVVALTMATLGFTGEANASQLLFSQPVTRTEILVGKVLGLSLSVVAATLGGFGLAGLVIASRIGTEGLARYLAFVGLAILLEITFLSLGAMVAILTGKKSKAFGFSLFVWFFFVLFYDLLVIGFAFVFKERTANLLVFLSLFGNPVDMVRVSSLITLNGASIFGAAGAALIKFLGGPVTGNLPLILGLLLWIAGPLLVSIYALRRQDI